MSHIAKRFSDSGFVVVAYDYRSHGKSGGSHKDIESFRKIMEDSNKFIIETESYLRKKYISIIEKRREEKNNNNEKSNLSSEEDTINMKSIEFVNKKFLIGISMGGLISIHLSKEHAQRFDGVMLLTPAVGTHVNCFTKFLAKSAVCCCSSMMMGVSNQKESTVSKNPNIFDHPDPLVSTEMALGGLLDVVSTIDQAKNIKGYEANFVLVQGGVDKFVPSLSAYDFYEKAISKDKDFWFYDNLWHGITAEEEFNEILEKLVSWAEKRM
eukprot:CAMPEP_0170516508 /NCGR_PEP_ID=MMETSP0209-20121228/2698_1 /TAXON_ID=665100 ORGANISM="Litonotus pictus, Strain P1" /NCGR_SAMPLE_ID=MMETSP0209 /ASSEMBLY_ACC=CAM_ASM_000301 /LENGTH=267 /DNA_ID=CAMNT_0010801407 /DNA_START=274 /DNA_END=1077 /DNA_ORIENTATION=-